MQPYGGGGEFWIETHETQIAWGKGTAMAGVTYVQRRVGTAYYKSHKFETGESVLDHLGAWLLAHGWRTSDGHTPSSSVLPKARFLAP
jgi:hypothetical protein